MKTLEAKCTMKLSLAASMLFSCIPYLHAYLTTCINKVYLYPQTVKEIKSIKIDATHSYLTSVLTCLVNLFVLLSPDTTIFF